MNMWLATFIVVMTVILLIAWWLFRINANTRDHVLLDWDGLRVTQTELIEGYSKSAKRHSLKGLEARVDEAGFVIVEGPNTAVVHPVPKESDQHKSDWQAQRAREFVANLNMRVHQLG
jgi:transcription initiation factor TFIID subunit TAF12